MDRYAECEECGFVVLSEFGDPIPKRVDACPGCDATSFRFTDE